MFTPVRYDSGKLNTKKVAASQTITKGMALVDDGNGLLAAATSSAADVPYVAMEDCISGSGTPDILVIDTDGVEFEALTNGTPAATDRQELCDLTDANTVNEAAATNKVFRVTELVSATNKLVLGYFLRKTA